MAGIFDKVSAFARSPQGKKLLKQAQDAAKDPKNRAKVQELGNKLKGATKQGGTTPRSDGPQDQAAPGTRPDPETSKPPTNPS